MYFIELTRIDRFRNSIRQQNTVTSAELCSKAGSLKPKLCAEWPWGLGSRLPSCSYQLLSSNRKFQRHGTDASKRIIYRYTSTTGAGRNKAVNDNDSLLRISIDWRRAFEMLSISYPIGSGVQSILCLIGLLVYIGWSWTYSLCAN
jgi:hypothetical protein